MINFCTLFDSNYLVNGLALYESLKLHCKNFHLYIFAFDDLSLTILNDLRLSDTTIISLAEFEDDKLLEVKSTRTRAEYCWTCTSSTILYILEKYNVEMCTYLDADIYFFSSPQSIFEEMGRDSVLITDHRYPDTYKWLESNGRYCVQFISFRNDEKGLRALRWWIDSCISWCYARLEKGKFGDQKYLDDWLTRFKGVHVLQHIGGGVAPWNVQRYIFHKDDDNKLFAIDKSTEKESKMIFYHFHDLKFLVNDKVQLTGAIFILDSEIKKNLYKPYLTHLLSIKERFITLNYMIDSKQIVPVHKQKIALLRKIKNKFIEISSQRKGNQLLNVSFWKHTTLLVLLMIKNKFNVYDIKDILA